MPIMYKKILAPLDGSPLSEQALPYVRSIAKGLQARVELLRVIEPFPPSGTADPDLETYRERIVGRMVSEAESYLDKVKGDLTAYGLEVSTAIGQGTPAERIISRAAKSPDTLVAMATHGRAGITRWVMGSITDKVLHAITNPLLVIRSGQDAVPPAAAELKSIIVPLDGSTVAEQVLPHVAPLAKALDLKVILLRVTTPVDLYSIYTEHFVARYDELSAEIDAQAREYLEVVAEKLRRQGIPSVEAHTLQGYPALAIMDFARETRNNLVAMATHGRSGAGRWVLGSIADRVVRHSGDPVLMVRAVEETPDP